MGVAENSVLFAHSSMCQIVVKCVCGGGVQAGRLWVLASSAHVAFALEQLSSSYKHLKADVAWLSFSM